MVVPILIDQFEEQDTVYHPSKGIGAVKNYLHV